MHQDSVIEKVQQSKTCPISTPIIFNENNKKQKRQNYLGTYVKRH